MSNEDATTSDEFIWNYELVRRLTDEIVATYQDQKGINHINDIDLPQSDNVLAALNTLLEVLFPGYTGKHAFHTASVEFVTGYHLDQAHRLLTEQVAKAYTPEYSRNDAWKFAEEVTLSLLRKIPVIRETLKKDVQAALDGDPAAESTDEVVIAYPGLKAIAIHRLAHELYKSEVPLVPRVMSEHAHSVTGIDIHPGAEIGESLFIDHGTGLVVGETAVIGRNVKLYQGVTLGAMSFPKDKRGKLIKGQKRHPEIGDNVTIYSGATILGAITVGHDSVVGGNVWLTESIAPHSKIMIQPPELTIKTRKQRSQS